MSPLEKYFHLSGDGISSRDTSKRASGWRRGCLQGRIQAALSAATPHSPTGSVFFGRHHRQPQTGGLNHRHVFSRGSGDRGPQSGYRRATLPVKALGCAGGVVLPASSSLCSWPCPSTPPLFSCGLPYVYVSPIVCLVSTSVLGCRAHPKSRVISS